MHHFNIPMRLVAFTLCAALIGPSSALAQATARSRQGVVVASSYSFSTTTCQTGQLVTERSSDGSEFGIQFPRIDMNGPADVTNASVTALSWAYELSGPCVAYIKSALRELILLDNRQVIRAAESSLVLHEVQEAAELLSPDKSTDYPSRIQDGTLLFFKLWGPVRLWLNRGQDGTYFTTIKTSASQETRLITSQLPMRSVTYFPGIHGGGGQVTIVQELPDRKLRVIVLDFWHP